MHDDAFTHVRGQIAAMRRAGLAGRPEEMGQLAMLAFAGIQTLCAVGQLSTSDQEQLAAELSAAMTELADDGQVRTGRVVASEGVQATMSMAMSTDPPGTRTGTASHRRRTLALDPVRASDGSDADGQAELVALHLFADHSEVEFWTWSDTFAAATRSLRARQEEVAERMQSMLEEGLGQEELLRRWQAAQQEPDLPSAREAMLREALSGQRWEVVLRDDLGTAYRTSPASGIGGAGRMIRRAEVHPAVPDTASSLEVVLLDDTASEVVVQAVPLT